jgi:aldehyde dehydrogenase (NAD+)
MIIEQILDRLGIDDINPGACAGEWFSHEGAETVSSLSPRDGSLIAQVKLANAAEYERVVQKSAEVFSRWRMLPAPKRGAIVREIGEELRAHKEDLGTLVSLEMGKIRAEGLGEVQEMIDIAEFAVGLSRQLYGLSMHSERPGHRMYEQWHPIGPVGVISAFNFPVAVWSWNAMIAAVCGDTVIWKPSLKTPLCAIAVQHLCEKVLKRHGWAGVFSLVIGADAIVGEKMIADRRIPLISATGSTRMGYRVNEVVAKRMGRTLLELGGNNGLIVMDDADSELALRAVLFGAAGTCGQRCTTIRRLFLQDGIYDSLLEKLIKAYGQLKIGDPLDDKTLIGPLIDEGAAQQMMAALEKIQQQGGKILFGGQQLEGSFVQPAIVASHAAMPMLKEEVFAPILHVIRFSSVEEALAMHNDVPQGLSSAIFTSNLKLAERFLSAAGSDCGIANVNIGTSGAEIGGAFGGEKDTGGGREAGSDSWKAYMRRQTVTINYSDDLPLAQGIKFEL